MAKKHTLQTKLAPLLLPFSWLYALIMFLRKLAYEKGLFKRYASEVPTICIGNISWGGTGKTPVVNYLASALCERKKKSVLLTRGYKAKLPYYPFLLNNVILESLEERDAREALSVSTLGIAKFPPMRGTKKNTKRSLAEKIDEEADDSIKFPDEALMLLKNNDNLEILISPNRVEASRRVVAFADLGKTKQSHLTSDHTRIILETNPALIYADFILMDDGFQHLKFCRDFDFVLLDKDDFYPQTSFAGIWDEKQSWNTQIPLGTWREHKSALKNADIFLLKCPKDEWILLREYALEKLTPFNKPFFIFDLTIKKLETLFDWTHFEKVTEKTMLSQEENISSCPEVDENVRHLLENHLSYALVCGVGNPDQVDKAITSYLDFSPAKRLFMPDHYDFTKSIPQLLEILEEMPIICTEKDAVKLCRNKAFSDTKYPIYVAVSTLNFYESAFYDRDVELQKAYARLSSSPTACWPKETTTGEEQNSKQEMTAAEKNNMYEKHASDISQSIANVLKPVDPFSLDDEFDPDYYKYQLHNPTYVCRKKIFNRFPYKEPFENHKEKLTHLSDFDHWLECNIFTIEPTPKLYKDYDAYK